MQLIGVLVTINSSEQLNNQNNLRECLMLSDSQARDDRPDSETDSQVRVGSSVDLTLAAMVTMSSTLNLPRSSFTKSSLI